MEIAESFALRSTCLRGQVGVVIVKDRHIISHGYNGAPSGQPQCDEVGGCDETVGPSKCPRCQGAGELPDCEPCFTCGSSGVVVQTTGCKRSIHAEANAIYYAAMVGVSCKDARMYSTHEPCIKCAQAILSAGITEVFYRIPYREGARSFLEDAGVSVWAV